METSLDAARQAVNDDPEFQLAARFWTATIRLNVGPTAYQLSIQDGHISGIAPAAVDASADVTVSVPAETWAEMLKPVPRPFYSDLAGSMLHHGVTVTGDTNALMPYYGAWRRFIDIVRSTESNP